jgi:hypothetical protein
MHLECSHPLQTALSWSNCRLHPWYRSRRPSMVCAACCWHRRFRGEKGRRHEPRRHHEKIIPRTAALYANNSAPACVKRTKVPDSCNISQPRGTARSSPALYSAGLPLSL